MNDYLLFLRGVNVSGKNILKMADFKECLHKNNFPNAKTYIQSGNILIPNTPLNSETLKIKIEELLLKQFNIDTICIVKTLEELKTTLLKVPFSTESTKEMYFTFLSELPAKKNTETLLEQNYNQDIFEIEKDCIYLKCANGYGKTKLNNNFFEKKLAIKATTRNWNTLTKMIALGDGL